MADEKIKNSRELEFAVFCIENVAAKLGVDAERVSGIYWKKQHSERLYRAGIWSAAYPEPGIYR